MHKEGWRPFWAALGAALLVLLPLVGGTVLLTRQMVRAQVQTAEPQRGVPVQLPKAEHHMTVLLCTAGEQPGFVLAYLNAAQNCLNLLAVPAELTVPFGSGEATLAHCYAAAGPARCRQALLEVLPLPEDTAYLAFSAAVLEKAAARYGPVRVSFAGALTAQELAQTGRTPAVESLSAKEAHRFLSGLDASAALPPFRRAAARAAVWDAFFRQNLELLPTTLPQVLRANSSALLTDFSAQDYTLLGEILEFLANGSALPGAQALPGGWDGTAYRVDEASRAAVQTLLNVSPTAGQAASASEP